MRRLRLVSLLIALPLMAASPEQDIRSVLDDQVAAWNRGDIPGFMEGYDKSESTTFVGPTITKGHAQVLANYRKRYPTPEKMGTLRFSDLEIRPLGADYASVIGKFHLDRSAAAGGESSGIFTLLFHKTAKGWKVILDHTS
jgi:ketosteroid isomerase-like protein